VRGILQTERQLENTRRKLQLLEDHYDARWHEESPDTDVEELSRQSVKRTINQLKEEVIWCEAHLAAGEKPPGAPVTRLRGSGFREGRSKVIPELDENGNLPRGIHRATLAEIDERFGRSTEVRRTEIQSLHWLMDLAKRAGIERLIVNGSFVTDVFEPNDVDCVLLMGASFPLDPRAAEELDTGLPYIHFQVVYQERFDYLVNRFFAADSRGNRKGVIEVPL
jgi:hypothetical protein